MYVFSNMEVSKMREGALYTVVKRVTGTTLGHINKEREKGVGWGGGQR